MASIQQQVLARAASRIGYVATNDPKAGSEAGRYWTARGKGAWLSGPSKSIWWCMLFQSMIFDECGQIDAIGGFSYNTDVTLNRNRGRLVSVANAQPGDVVIFNWNGGGTDHVGIVEKNLGSGVLQTIEGNTSSGAAGSQSSGNGVWRRRRSGYIAAIIRPAWKTSGSSSSNSNAGKPTNKTDGQLTLSINGSLDGAAIARFQQVMNTKIDGVKSSPSDMIRAFQRFLNSKVSAKDIQNLTGKSALDTDGYDGARTWKVFQYWAWNVRPDLVKAYSDGRAFTKFVDGDPGTITIKILKHMLNESYSRSGKLLSK